MALRRALALALLALAAFSWIQPLGAFDLGSLQSRTTSATLVTDASSYIGLSGGACNVPITGGTCTFTISNLGTVAQTYSVTLEAEQSNVIGNYAVTSGNSVSSGATVTPADVGVTSSTTLTADVNVCIGCSTQTRTADWKIEGNEPGVVDAERTLYRMTITYL